MFNIEIFRIEILANSNITEDPQKVFQCIKNLLSYDISDEEIQFKTVKGGYNNPIKILSFVIEDPKLIQSLLENLKQNLSDKDKNKLLFDLSKKINKSDMFLRFRKDFLFNNIIRISNKSDVIRCIFSFRNKANNSRKKINLDLIKDYLNKNEILK